MPFVKDSNTIKEEMTFTFAKGYYYFSKYDGYPKSNAQYFFKLSIFVLLHNLHYRAHCIPINA